MLTCHLDIIDAFGGVRPLAEAIGVDPKLAIHWCRRGIPVKHWHKVATAARRRRIPLAVTGEGQRIPLTIEAIAEMPRLCVEPESGDLAA